MLGVYILYHMAKKHKFHPESKWHKQWKERFDSDLREFRIYRDGSCKTADIRNRKGFVIEFQHSQYTFLYEKELYFKNMAWVFDLNAVYLKNNKLQIIEKSHKYKDAISFTWRTPLKIRSCNKPVYLDTGDFLILVLTHSHDGENGYGIAISYDDFVSTFNI